MAIRAIMVIINIYIYIFFFFFLCLFWIFFFLFLKNIIHYINYKNIIIGKSLLDDVKSETSGNFGQLCCALSMTIAEYDVKCLHDVKFH